MAFRDLSLKNPEGWTLPGGKIRFDPSQDPTPSERRHVYVCVCIVASWLSLEDGS